MDLPTMGSLPGVSTLTQSYEAQILWGGNQARVLYDTDCVIKSTTVDAGNTPTTTLRAGLVLGRKTSDGLLYAWNHDASDGTEIPVGVLLNSISMLGASGSVEDKDAGAQGVCISGPIKASLLFIEGTAFGSSDNAYLLRKLWKDRFLFDDDKGQLYSGDIKREVAKTANYTVVATDVGTLFTNAAASGSVTFTLPAIKPGIGPFKFKGVVDQTLAIASAEGDNIVLVNDAAADSATFSTSSMKIGAGMVIYANTAGTLWYAELATAGVTTVSVAT